MSKQQTINAPFIEDIKEIDEKLNYDSSKFDIQQGKLYVSFMPYYVDPDTMSLTVVLKREIQPGSFIRTGKKMGLSTLNVELPIDNPLTIEEAFKKLDIDVNIQNAIPFGSVMLAPTESDQTIEMVLVQIDPPTFLDEKRQIIKQEPEKYEIGTVPFDALLAAIHDNFLQDITTRMMLSELYILAMEEANNQQYQNGADFSEASQNNNSLIGGGSNHTTEFYENAQDENLPRTSNINEELLKQNSQKDFGAIYQNL